MDRSGDSRAQQMRRQRIGSRNGVHRQTVPESIMSCSQAQEMTARRVFARLVRSTQRDLTHVLHRPADGTVFLSDLYVQKPIGLGPAARSMVPRAVSWVILPKLSLRRS